MVHRNAGRDVQTGKEPETKSSRAMIAANIPIRDVTMDDRTHSVTERVILSRKSADAKELYDIANRLYTYLAEVAKANSNPSTDYTKILFKSDKEWPFEIGSSPNSTHIGKGRTTAAAVCIQDITYLEISIVFLPNESKDLTACSILARTVLDRFAISDGQPASPISLRTLP